MSQSHARPPGGASAHRRHIVTSTPRRSLRTPRAEHSIFSPHLSHSVASSIAESNASNASRFSLSTSFIHLTAEDVAFFDEVVEILGPGVDDFASLKKAYNQLRNNGQYDIDEDKDAFLWDTLLKLIQVRGKDWSARWDAVRLAIGLESRLVSESERERTDDVDGEGDDDDEDEDELGDTSDSETVRDQQQQQQQQQQHFITPAKANTTRVEIEALRKRMAMLTAEAGSLVGSIAKKATHRHQEQFDQNQKTASALASREDKLGKATRDTPGRQLRFAEDNQQENFRSEKATFVESASDEEGTRPRASKLARQLTPSLDHRPAVAQRQFDEVVARSRIEREAQKRSQEEQQEAILEARLLPLLSQADKKAAINLGRKCFTWWRTSLHQRRKREGQTMRARKVVILAKALSAWRYKLQKRKEKMRGAEKVDVVRCKLRAWRVWRRNLQESRYTRREEKRSQLKGAFVLTRKKVEQRVVKASYLQWKIALMERRTAVFRTQHLVQGAFSLWRLHLWRTRSLKEQETIVMNRIEYKLMSATWEKWRGETREKVMTHLADKVHRHGVLQASLRLWTIARERRGIERRKEELADRLRGRRTKKAALRTWQLRITSLKGLQREAQEMRVKKLKELRHYALRVWILREREQLFVRVKASTVKSHALVKWVHNYRQLTSNLETLEKQLAISMRVAILQKSFHVWRDVTAQSLASQYLASKRDHRRVKMEAFGKWRDVFVKRQGMIQRAKRFDSTLLQRRMWFRWLKQLLQAKSLKLEKKRNDTSKRAAFTYWKARSAEKGQERVALGLMKGRIETRIQKAFLDRWTSAVIERRSLLLEAGDRRDGIILQDMWFKWINACLRHEDLLNLSKSFLDVKKEELIQRYFVKWTTLAKSLRNQRERVDYLLQQKKRATAIKVFDQWYDRYVEATLRSLEYEALLQRQQAVMLTSFTRWKSTTKSLPAIQFDQARCKSHTFYKWQTKLPLAQMKNKALRQDRLNMQDKGFRHWFAATKAKRALRAAARFGGSSAVRLGAAAHLRQKSGGNPYGGAASSSSPDTRARHRPISVKKPIRPGSQPKEPYNPTRSSVPEIRREDIGSLRESDLVGSIEVDLNRQRDAKRAEVAIPTAMRRWMQNVGQDRREMTLAYADTSSEPPSSILEYRQNQRRAQMNRTPSPPASQAYSEATMRVKNSPRRPKKANVEADLNWLRLRRREQSKSMILDSHI